MGTAAVEPRQEARPVCPRCCAEVDESRYYCPDCGGPVRPFTMYLPYESIPAEADFLARATKVSCFGDGLAWPLRVLVFVFLVLVLGPILLLVLPFVLLRRRRGRMRLP